MQETKQTSLEPLEPERRLKILHLLSFAKYTGPAEPVLQLARSQCQLGHDVRLAIDTKRRGNLLQRAAPYGVPIDNNLVLSATAGPFLQLRNLLALNRIWRENKVHIIHANRTNDHTLAAMARPRKTSVRLVRTLFTERAQSRWRGWQLRRTDGVIVVSEGYRKSLLGRGYLDPSRVVAISGAVNSDLYQPDKGREKIREEAGIELQAPVAGIVARMKTGRGHHWLLESWDSVHKALPDARLVIAGRGPLAKSLKAFADQASWGKSVVFIGYRTDLPEVYRALDLKIILAPGNDGTCRAALEAMASAVPVLAAKVGALGEIVENGRTGRLVPNNDRKALSQALIGLLSNPEQLSEMGIHALRAATSQFTIERQVKIIEKLYRRVLKDVHKTSNNF